MSQFIQFFGEQIMVLWKFALLRKRLLIFSPPPVGVVCYRGEMHKKTFTHQVQSNCLFYHLCIFPIFFSPSLSVLLLLPGQRLFARDRCLCAGTAAFFLHQRSWHSCFANRDVLCGLWVFDKFFSFSQHPTECNDCSTVGLANIYFCFYRIMLTLDYFF